MDLSLIWTKLPPGTINQSLNSDFLHVLESLLDRETEDIPLVDDIIEKSEIYKYSNMHKLSNKNFRKILFEKFTRDELKEISKQLNLKETNINKILNIIINFEWSSSNEKLKILLKLIGVPEFILDIEDNSINLDYNNKIKPLLLLENKNYQNIKPFKYLKWYQYQLTSKILENINSKLYKAILSMPTGTGKTRTAMEIVCNYLLMNPSKLVFWVANTKELLEQAKEEFKQIWTYLGNKEIQINIINGNFNLNEIENNSFNIISFQNLLNKSKNLKKLNIGLVIVDEAHMAIATKWKESLNDIIRLDLGTSLIGLTATPIRGDEVSSKDLFNFFDKRVFEISFSKEQNIYKYLIQNKYLAVPKYESIKGINIDLKKLNLEIDFSDKVLKEISLNKIRNLRIVDKLKKILGNPSNSNQVLFFASSVEHSKMINYWLNKNSYSSFHIDGSLDKKSRSSVINSFKKGKIRVLCNYGVLSTGFDVPKIDCIMITRPTTSEVLHSQMVGRGLRGPKLGGTETCLIVEVEDNIINFGKNKIPTFEKYKEKWEI